MESKLLSLAFDPLSLQYVGVQFSLKISYFPFIVIYCDEHDAMKKKNKEQNKTNCSKRSIEVQDIYGNYSYFKSTPSVTVDYEETFKIDYTLICMLKNLLQNIYKNVT